MRRWAELRHRVSDHDGAAEGTRRASLAHASPAHAHLHAPHPHAPFEDAQTQNEVEVDPSTLPERTFPSGGSIYFDAPSGAGGDMIVAALLDLGVPWTVVSRAVEALDLPDVQVRLLRGTSGALGGLRVRVDAPSDQPQERSYADIRELLAAAPLLPEVRRMAGLVFERLARAEAKVHQVPVDDVHFHEVGAVDSIVDIVAACAALQHAGGEVWCSPLPLGRGYVHCRHGVVPLPAPATVECLIGLVSFDAGAEGEFVTPTAAAIFGSLCQGSSGWPTGRIAGVGWGRGSRHWTDRPNLLRVVRVTPADGAQKSSFSQQD